MDPDQWRSPWTQPIMNHVTVLLLESYVDSPRVRLYTCTILILLSAHPLISALCGFCSLPAVSLHLIDELNMVLYTQYSGPSLNTHSRQWTPH